MSILSQFNQSQNTDFPNVRPSLDLRFALAKKLDPRITFTRGSTGTYFGSDGIMRTAGVNEPRFDHDPITGQSLGLLIEESRTNLLVRSEDFTTTWGVSNGSVQSNIITAPDGNTTADKLVENSASGNKEVTQGSITFTSGTSLTFSCFAKAGERTLFRLAATTGFFASPTNAFFNLSNGTVSLIQGGVTSASIIPYPNGWYRCVATVLPTSSGSGNVYITLVRSETTSTYGGDGTSGIYIWGAQLEAGAFPTSYIPTTASTVTRSADTSNIANISSFFNSNEGTLFVDSEIPYQTNLRFPAIGFTRGAGSGNTIQFYYYNTNTPYVTYLVRDTANKGGNLISWDSPTQTLGSYKKFIATYKVGEFNYYFDGKLVIRKTDTNKALPTNLTSLDFGYNTPGSPDRLNGHIRRVTYYPIQLTNQQLINLTS